ncbi:MAG: NifB/NifX family molybdenum-iron cluster-binding protein [Candidatus Latescibacterota bacterium]
MRFGRCPYFVVVDSETMRADIFSNPAVEAPGGAGPQTAQAFRQRGVEVVLTGQVGPNAQRALEAAGIKIVSGVSGKVQAAVEAYLKSTAKG